MTKEKAIKELESVEMMTRRYRDYLAAEKQGGDWPIEQFMHHLNDTVIKARVALSKV